MRMILILSSIVAIIAGSCTTTSSPSLTQTAAPTTPSAMTPGMIKTKLVIGKTTQAEIREIFGPPDHVTSSGKREVWKYGKVPRGESTVFLLVYFDEKGILTDYELLGVERVL